MKSNIILVTLLVILLLSGNIYANFDRDKETFNKLFSYNEDSKLEKLFHESFLKQISVAKIVSIITKSSARRLASAEGKEVYAVIKASHVMIATD